MLPALPLQRPAYPLASACIKVKVAATFGVKTAVIANYISVNIFNLQHNYNSMAICSTLSWRQIKLYLNIERSNLVVVEPTVIIGYNTILLY